MAKAKVDVAEEPKISKRKMVEQALESLGHDIGPKEIQAHLMEKYNTEITTQMASSYKSQILSKGGSKGGRSKGSGTGSLDITDVATVSSLLNRLGAAKLQELIGALNGK